MVKQKWVVTIDDSKIDVEYSCSAFWGKTTLTVDGDSFTVKGKPFGIGLARSEQIIVGGEQALLQVAKGGRAKLICREGNVEEI
jgi:hypothetical protein